MLHRWSGRLVLVIGLVVGLVGSTTAQVVPLGTPAPEITGGPWINSNPLTLSALRGRVVLMEFWTYG